MKKTTTFITRPEPGRPLEVAMPVNVVMKEVLSIGVHTSKEAKKIIDAKKVNVDGKPITSYKRPVGFMDILSLPELKQNYRFVLNTKGKLQAIAVDDKEAAVKAGKVVKKTVLKGGKQQVTLSDGRNLLTDKKFGVGDTLLIEVPSQNVKKHLELKKGVHIYLTGGKHVGKTGTLKEIHDHQVTFEADGQEIVTSKEYAMAIGDKAPEVKIHE